MRPDLPPLRLPPLGTLHRSALALVLAVPVVLGGIALCLHVDVGLLDRARLSEVTAMMGHARKEIVLESVQRPASRGPGAGDPVALATLETSANAKRLSVRYDREGDRVVARFQAPADAQQQGTWILAPVESPDVSSWVSNWRCASRSTGRWRQIGQGLCPDASSKSP